MCRVVVLFAPQLMEGSTPLPKGVPSHVRQNYHYFTFDTAMQSDASTCPESCIQSLCSQHTPKAEAVNSAGGRGGKNCRGPSPTGVGCADGESDNCCTEEGCALPQESKEDGEHEQAARPGPHTDEEKEQEDDQPLTSCSWAPSLLTECSVCLERYRGGDKMCRLPCAHAFHAAVSCNPFGTAPEFLGEHCLELVWDVYRSFKRL